MEESYRLDKARNVPTSHHIVLPPKVILIQYILGKARDRHEHSPPPNGPFFRGGTAFPVHCTDMFITQKCHIFKNEEVLWGPPLNITNIYTKFYNIMKYIIKIILIGVSGL